jgi:multicomponent Na+:H+ antiporter subunit D
MGDLLLHPALPLLVAAVLAWWAPPRLGRVLLVLAPLVALAQLSQLGTGATVTVAYLDFELTVLRADGLAMAFAWVFAIAAVIAGTFGLATVRARERTSVLAYAGPDTPGELAAWLTRKALDAGIVLDRDEVEARCPDWTLLPDGLRWT